MFQTKEEFISLLDEYLLTNDIPQESVDKEKLLRHTLKKIIERDFVEFLEKYKAVLDLIIDG